MHTVVSFIMNIEPPNLQSIISSYKSINAEWLNEPAIIAPAPIRCSNSSGKFARENFQIRNRRSKIRSRARQGSERGGYIELSLIQFAANEVSPFTLVGLSSNYSIHTWNGRSESDPFRERHNAHLYLYIRYYKLY